MAWGSVSTSTRFTAVAIVADAAKRSPNAAAPARKRDAEGATNSAAMTLDAIPRACIGARAAEPTSADSARARGRNLRGRGGASAEGERGLTHHRGRARDSSTMRRRVCSTSRVCGDA